MGTEAFIKISEDVTEVVEKRQASMVVVRVVRPKFVPKGESSEACPIRQAAPAERPIPKSMAGPGLLADSIVRRRLNHLPLHRLESIYAREGLKLARSTVCGWHMAAAELVQLLVDALFADALAQPYLCTDATGVLVQDKHKCRRSHFWVLIAPEMHVLFQF